VLTQSVFEQGYKVWSDGVNKYICPPGDYFKAVRRYREFEKTN
jgi:hypothetical protein